MRIVTWNVNGLRAALRKGFMDHIKTLNPDVILLQEIRVLPEQLSARKRAQSRGMACYLASGRAQGLCGYSGMVSHAFK